MHPIIGYARVKKIPTFDAPKETNEAWVGLVIPYVGENPCSTGKTIGLKEILRSKTNEFICLIGVPWKEAIETLGKKSEAAANYWLSIPSNLPESERLFIFGNDDLEDVGDC